MPSCASSTVCGPTSIGKPSRRRWWTSRVATGDSGGWPPRKSPRGYLRDRVMGRRTQGRRVAAPADMVVAPALGPLRQKRLPVKNLYALLVNPFYPKDPRASYGKHVLTPT